MRRVFAFLLLAALAACHRQDIRTVEIRVPQMDSEEAARRVLDALAAYASYGVASEIHVDFTNRVVRVTYNSTQIALKNFEYIIARAGFDANDLRAEDVIPPQPAEATKPETPPSTEAAP